MGLTTVNEQEVTFGAKAGVNFANVTGDVENADSKIGFHVGRIVEIAISEKFSIQPELLYSAKGYKSEFTEEFIGEIYKEQFDTKYYVA